jgi:hypothetical protein
MIAMINNRPRFGKTPVSFTNPALYAHQHGFRVVTEGYNTRCGIDEAFQFDEGWDPVKGGWVVQITKDFWRSL